MSLSITLMSLTQTYVLSWRNVFKGSFRNAQKAALPVSEAYILTKTFPLQGLSLPSLTADRGNKSSVFLVTLFSVSHLAMSNKAHPFSH